MKLDVIERLEFCIGLSPFSVRVTTRIITFLVGDPYKPSFATVTGRGDNPSYVHFSPLDGRLLASKAEFLEAWPQALALLHMVECKKLYLQQITYNAAIRALGLVAAIY